MLKSEAEQKRGMSQNEIKMQLQLIKSHTDQVKKRLEKKKGKEK